MSDEAKTSRKRNLPRSGLASDILKIKQPSDTQQASTEPAEIHVETLEATNPQSGGEVGRAYEFGEDSQNQEFESEEAVQQQLEAWVIFEVGKESYGFPVSHVQEILRVENIARVPQAPQPVRGITDMRGYLLPVVDLKLRLELGKSEVTPMSRILVANSRDKLIGFLVDSVQQIIKLDRLKFETPPDDVMTSLSDYVQAVYHLPESLVILFDIERVLLIKNHPEETSANKPKADNP